MDLIVERMARLALSYAEANGLSGRELSTRAGCSPGMVKDLASGRVQKPMLHSAIGLARVMGIELEDLIDPERPLPAWGSRAPGGGDSAVEIPYAAIQPGSGLIAAEGHSLSLPLWYVRMVLGASTEALAAWVSTVSAPDHDVRIGDHLVIDHLARGGLEFWMDRDEPWIGGGSGERRGRIVLIMRRP